MLKDEIEKVLQYFKNLKELIDKELYGTAATYLEREEVLSYIDFAIEAITKQLNQGIGEVDKGKKS